MSKTGEMMNTQKNGTKVFSVRFWRLTAFLLCVVLSGKGEEAVFPAARTAALVVAAYDSPVHVRASADYVCHGFDDHVVINEAIEALPESGGRVHLAAGTYSIGGIENTHGGISIFRGNVTLSGEGAGTKLILQEGLTDINVIWIYGGDIRDVTVRDLYINGNGKKQTPWVRSRSGWSGGNGVKAIGDSRENRNTQRNIRVENCRIENCQLMAVMLHGDTVEVLNCYFTGDFGSHVVELLGFNGRIEGCKLNVRAGDSVGFGLSTDAMHNYRIINNQIIVEHGGRIRSHAINNWRRRYHGIIAGNIIVNNGQSGSVRIQGLMDMVNNNVFRNVKVEIQGEGIMFGHNMLINSPLEIKASIHQDILDPIATADQLPIQIGNNWFCESPVDNIAGNVIMAMNHVTNARELITGS